MKNGLFTTNWATVGEALLSAVLFAVLGALVSLVSQGNFDVFTADWTAIGHNMVNLGFMAGVVTLGNDLLTTNSGSLLGIGPTSQ